MGNRFHKARLRSIAKQFGLHVHRLKSYDSLYKRNAVYRASTYKGKFLIKVFQTRNFRTQITKKQQSIQVSSYIRKLKDRSYPNIANWLTTNFGGHYVHKNGRQYYMTEWIDGHQLQNDVLEYQDLGRALAKLHTICKDCLSSTRHFTKRQIKLLKFQGRLFRLRLTDNRVKSFSQKWFQEHGDRCIALAHEAWKILRTPEVKQILSHEIRHPALIHGDVTYPNIIINSKGLFLIDWDCLKIGSTYYEIAKTLSNTTNFNLELIAALLRGYEEIKPLKSAERLLISALFRLPREAWSEARNIVLGRGHRGFHVLQQTWDQRMIAIQWLDGWASQLPTIMNLASDNA